LGRLGPKPDRSPQTGQLRQVSFTTGAYSATRLQQLLAQLGYLPLNWTASDPAAFPLL
jgi:hypothetical protein